MKESAFIYFIFYHFQNSSFLCVDPSFCLVSYFFLKNFFWLCLYHGSADSEFVLLLFVRKDFWFCFVFLLLYLKGIFLGHRIVNRWVIFSPAQYFKVSIHDVLISLSHGMPVSKQLMYLKSIHLLYTQKINKN